MNRCIAIRFWWFCGVGLFAVIPAMLASCDKSPACRMDESYLRLPCKERPVSDEPFEYAGQVLGPDGKPVAGAAVEVFEQFWFNCQVNRRMDSAVTDADGRFRMTGKPSRRYNNILLIAHSKGFAVSCRHLAPWQGAYCVMTLGEPVSVGGVVIDENYRPVAGATVCPRLDDNWRLFYLCMEGLVPSLTAVTDENGRFRLDNVPAGASADEFFVKADGMATGVVWDDIFEKEDRDDFLLLMEKEAVITGSVVEKKTGRPVAGVAIEATMDTGGFFVGSYSDCLPCPVAVTDGTGRFRIGGLPQGRYDLHAAWPPRQPEKWAIESENVFVETGQVIEDVEISTVPCGVMELKLVSPNGSPAAFRPMYFNLADSGDRYYCQKEETGRDGILTMPTMPGEYDVVVMPMLFAVRSGLLGNFSGWRSHPLDVRPGRRNSLTIPYDDSLKYLTGVVVDSAGQPVPGAMLTVGPAFGFEMLTDSKGRFSIPCFMFKRQCLLYSENDFVLLTGPDTWNQQDYILVRCDHRNLAAIAEFDIEKESDLKIVMSDGVTITGDVAVSDGRPLNGGTVCCYTVINGLSYGLPGEKVTFDGDRYKIGPFPAGLACQFEVTAPGCGNTRLRVEVPKEAGREVVPEKITLPARNMSVSGTVQTESGSSFDIATVYARQEGQGQPIMVMTGDRFTIEGLVAGKVVLSVCASSRYVAFEKCEVEVQAGDTDVKMVLHTKLNIEDDDGD